MTIQLKICKQSNARVHPKGSDSSTISCMLLLRAPSDWSSESGSFVYHSSSINCKWFTEEHKINCKWFTEEHKAYRLCCDANTAKTTKKPRRANTQTHIQVKNYKKLCYVSQIHTSHTKHTELDPFNVCSNHISLKPQRISLSK